MQQKKAVEPPIRRDRDGLTRCRVCGCTDVQACCPPCGWVPGEYDLCTACDHAAETIAEWLEGSHRPSKAALLREVARLRARGGLFTHVGLNKGAKQHARPT